MIITLNIITLLLVAVAFAAAEMWVVSVLSHAKWLPFKKKRGRNHAH